MTVTMKKIGFIDYYLDEWHANNYPQMIHELSGGEMEVGCAFGLKDADGGMTNKAWAEQYKITLVGTIEELIEKSDYLMVLSPDNPEMHEQLSALALRSGKRTFIDKTFAPSKAAAQRIFDMAEKGGTPMYSCSAVRFAKEFQSVNKDGVDFIAARGPGCFDNYLIHQVEPVVSIMGADVARILYCGTAKTPALLLEYTDGRRASISMLGWDCPFSFAIGYDENTTAVINDCTEYFEAFLKNVLHFFSTGEGRIPPQETIAIMAVLEKAHEARQKAGQWIEV